MKRGKILKPKDYYISLFLCGSDYRTAVAPTFIFFFIYLSSKGIEPFTAINQFFYRESPLPIGSPAHLFNIFLRLLCHKIILLKYYLFII